MKTKDYDYSMNSNKKKIFIGVAWPYVNGDIHIGHLAGYLLPADIFARFHRFRGNDVLMVSGSDCFGTPITLEADKRGVLPQEIVEEYHEKNAALFRDLNLSFDLYTKTDTKNHRKITQDFFLRLLKGGFIFKDKTKQYYSPVNEHFLPDRYVEGKCPNCGYEAARSDQCDNCGTLIHEGTLLNPRDKITGGPVELKPSEHYFLDWRKLQPFLEKYITARGKNWRSWVLKETKGWLKSGLKPRPITRDIDWGVEIPIEQIPEELKIKDADKKRIYVWFDAVIGYLSASIEWSKKTDRDWKEFWYDEEVEHAYFMGKDNLVFHTLFWPGQLHGYDEKIHLPDFPAVNQFLNLEGQKFSKGRGVTIDSRYIAEKYGLDAARFYLTTILPEDSDANFGWQNFVNAVNSVLVANLGNFLNRTLTLAKGLNFKEVEVDRSVKEKTLGFIEEAKKAAEKYKFKRYAETVLALSDFGNKYLSKEEPWFLKEKDESKFKNVLGNALYIILGLFLLLKPLLPGTYEKLEKSLGVGIDEWSGDEDKLLAELLKRVKIQEVQPLFKKIDESVIEIERKKIAPAQGEQGRS
ncbi:MAG: Methionyl-tRNA synthetase [Candidatus Jorgensenbacteria bacterium GW2011_GWB1_50_10]|uniref:Methionine--tRNA ligase n=1 Tax=Candidatus Jorgensenbacteria bacterium GW2011_GWB1_50_10 TaxID=1618665 RepID=A0A0G1W9Q7_9BACT|nr:MAG: Methionyl-tRNA synthetase [Candidatus Jorgensenbacteria bacterium GW2011_GWB1_50_10]